MSRRLSTLQPSTFDTKKANAFFVDTHCHIHDASFKDKFGDKDPDVMIQEAEAAGVCQLICVGTDLESSKQAIAFCDSREGCHASIALHPHEAADVDDDLLKKSMKSIRELAEQKSSSLVAIGECGLDYFYHDDEVIRARQKHMLRLHLDIAVKSELPVIFHIRDAFEDFFEIFDEYDGVRGVVHSFSATKSELKEVLKRDLYVGLNGIMTFTKDAKQLDAAKAVPLDKLVVETDAPFLTPVPLRGKMCEPKHVVLTAEFLSTLRGEDLEVFAAATTANAQHLFGI